MYGEMRIERNEESDEEKVSMYKDLEYMITKLVCIGNTLQVEISPN